VPSAPYNGPKSPVLRGRSRPDELSQVPALRTRANTVMPHPSVLTFHNHLERTYCLLDLVLIGCAVTENKSFSFGAM
jgi:hypothetical protein